MHPYHHPLFVQFLVYFNTNQDYFEGHEVLEEYWKSVPGHSKSHPLTAYILLTTGMYHWRRGNYEGAARTFRKSFDRFSRSIPLHPAYRQELDYGRLIEDMQLCQQLIHARQPFTPFRIEPAAHALKQAVADAALSMPLLPAASLDVVHKHMRRDRSDILKLRDEKKKSGR